MSVLALLLLAVPSVLGQCPGSILPCRCYTEGPTLANATLDCSSVTAPEEFATIVGLQQAKGPLKFKEIVIRYSTLNMLPPLAFGRAVADVYEITNNGHLEEVSPGALGSFANPKILKFSRNLISVFPFVELARYRNIEEIHLDNNALLEVPDYAFENVGKQTLRKINLSFNEIERIGFRAFAGPKKALEAIILNHNPLPTLGSLSLCMDSPNVTVILYGCQINQVLPDSFGAEYVCGSSYPRELVLAYNQITTLDSFVWRKILDEMKKKPSASLILSGNPINCDCRMEWAYFGNYTDVLQGAVCREPRELSNFLLSEIPETYFNTCLRPSLTNLQAAPL